MENYPAYFKIKNDDGCTYIRIEGPSNETWLNISGPEFSQLDGHKITDSSRSIDKRVVSSVPFFPKGFLEDENVISSAEEFKQVLKEFYDFLAEQG